MASLAADSQVSDFMAFSGCNDPAAAAQYLEMASGNLQNAVQLFMAAGPTIPNGNSHESPQIRAPDPVKRQRLVAGPMYDGQPRRSTNSRETFRSFRQEAQQARRSRTQTNNSKNKGRADVADLTPKQKSLQTMFAPPVDIMFQGDFEMAKAAARSSGRWLLINIQKNDVFACHSLNRDVWKDDYAKAMISDSLVFWFATMDSGPGQRFATLYKVTEFPHVALVDPRTGEQSKIILSGGEMTSRDFVERVQDYVQRHAITPFDSNSSSSSNSNSNSNSSTTSTASSSSSNTSLLPNQQPSTRPSTSSSGRKREEEDEDAMLQRALAASLMDSNDNASSSISSASATTVSASTSTSSSVEPTVAPPSPPKPVLQDYGTAPTEPETTIPTSETTRLRLKLSTGKQVVRKFLKQNTVRELFAVVRQLLDAEEGSDTNSTNFELRAGFPPKILSGGLDDTLTEAGICNASVNVVID